MAIGGVCARFILEELALGGAGVSNDANVDVSPEGCALHGRLGNATKQHQQDPALDLIITWQPPAESLVNFTVVDKVLQM